VAPRPMTAQQRLDSILGNASEDENGCWIWHGAMRPHGYGHVHYMGRAQGVHRIVYELMVHEIPEGLEIDHLCLTKACVNPYHMDPVTHAVNMQRMHALRRR